MARPSQRIDQALLASGRTLFAQCGCAGLSLRQLAEHAGVNLGMFHYHFKTKDNFLRTLLQQMYDEMFAGLSHQAQHDGPAVERLRLALNGLGRFVRANRPVITRVWSDAMAGEAVAREFMRANAPRHIQLLQQLLALAESEGAVAPAPPIQRLAFVMGAVIAPLVIVPGIGALGITVGVSPRQIELQALSDAAVADRVGLALAALRPTSPLPARPRTRTHA